MDLHVAVYSIALANKQCPCLYHKSRYYIVLNGRLIMFFFTHFPYC